jgi:MoxR-like ATPase
MDKQELDRLVNLMQAVRQEVGQSVVGQGEVVDQLLVALLCGGHVLLEGTPGLGKTLLMRTIGAVAGLSVGRVQFTPDLMPADILGGVSLAPDEAGRMSAKFERGPIFSEMLLADEINRATPKTQSALLEAMQEGTVTIAGTTHQLPKPFFVLATQNPLDMDGTYTLPEAQVDRFLFKSIARFPTVDELDAILALTTGSQHAHSRALLTRDDIVKLQALVRDVPIANHVRQVIARLTLATQPEDVSSTPAVKKYFRYGVSPRGAQSLVLAAKGVALLSGRYHVTFDDVAKMLMPALRHRVHLSLEAELERIDLTGILTDLLNREIKRAA